MKDQYTKVPCFLEDLKPRKIASEIFKENFSDTGILEFW